jgi:hypothetical protein
MTVTASEHCRIPLAHLEPPICFRTCSMSIKVQMAPI